MPLKISMPSPKRPGLPPVWGVNRLSSISACIGCWDFRSIGDQSGNKHYVVGEEEPDLDPDQGLMLPGGESGWSVDCRPTTPDYTFALAAKIAPDAAGSGFLVSSISDDGNSGAGIRYDVATQSLFGVVINAAGAAVATSPGIVRAPGTWFAVCFRTTSTAPSSAVSFLYPNSGVGTTSAVLGTRNVPGHPIMLGDGYLTTKGIKASLGMFGVFNSLKTQTEMTEIIAQMRLGMAERHGVTIP